MSISQQGLTTNQKKQPRFRPDWWLLAILGAGLALRLLVWLIATHRYFVIDEAEYYQISSILADGRGWQFYDGATWVRPPLFILMLAGFFKLFGHDLIIIRLFQICLSLASVYLLYWLGKRLYGRRTGLIAALLASIAWPFVVFPYLLLSETLFILLFLVSVCFFAEFFATSKTDSRNKWLPESRTEWLTLVGGSFFLGLSALTRGQVLSFVPFLAIWFWIGTGRKWKPTIGAFVVMLVIFAITVSPWALRNSSVYGRPFIDNTGGYNFFLGAMKGRNGALVSQTLEAVKNMAERDSVGYQKGLEIFFKDPAAFIFDKGIKEALDFWQINYGADERLVGGYSLGQINPPWLLLDATLNDLLYLVTGALAMLGLVVATSNNRAVRSFVVIWTAQNMILAFTFFAVTRFRVSVYFFLLLYAAYTMANWRKALAWFKRPLRNSRVLRYAVGLVLPVLFLAVALPSYAPFAYLTGLDNQWGTALGLERWNEQQNAQEGDRLRLEGKYQEALNAYAKANQSIPATQISIGLTEAALGRFDDAIGRIGRTSQDISQSHIALGYIYLLQGNIAYAHGEFNTRQVALDQQADEWAWEKLPTSPLPDNTLVIGEFDWGYTYGFQTYEKDAQTGKLYRWTSGRGDSGQELARLKFPNAGTQHPVEVNLRLRGFRPDSLTPPLVEVYAKGQLLGKVQTSRNWETYNLKLPSNLSGDIIIELGADTFVPGSNSRRELGVMVESATLK